MRRRSLLPLAFFFTTFALALVVTGGFATMVAGVRVSARDPGLAVAAASIAIGAWLAAAWRAHAIADDVAYVDAWVTRHGTRVIATIAALGGAVAVLYGSYSAAGSDASGYLSQAAMLARGELTRAEPLVAAADWRDAETTLAPLGWRPAPESEPGRQVPTYAVGMPLLLLLPQVAGGVIGASLIVPLSFALAIVTTGLMARLLAGPWAGVFAATWLATSPVALIESMQPMSDVPVTAAWIACWAVLVMAPPSIAGTSMAAAAWSLLRRALVAGVVAAVAVLIRPNLAPLAALPALFLLFHASAEAPEVRRVHRLRARAPAFLLYLLPVALAGAAVAYLQWRYFGSALRSGYGAAHEIYAWANVAPNASLYTQWLLDTHGPWLLAAPVAALWPHGSRTILRWLLAFAALVCVSYLVYSVFETWTYLRFLLPAMAIAAIAVAALVAGLAARLPRARVPLLAVVILVFATLHVDRAVHLGVFRFARQQSRAALAGRYLDARLPVNAVIVSGEQSGSARYYTGRSIVRWDFLDPSDLDRVLARLTTAGYDPWIVLDVWEEEPFRQKFRGATAAALDWPPMLDAGTDMRTRAWRVRDRVAFVSGGRVASDRLR